MNIYPIGRSKWDLDTPVLCLDAAALEGGRAYRTWPKSLKAPGPSVLLVADAEPDEECAGVGGFPGAAAEALRHPALADRQLRQSRIAPTRYEVGADDR